MLCQAGPNLGWWRADLPLPSLAGWLSQSQTNATHRRPVPRCGHVCGHTWVYRVYLHVQACMRPCCN